MATLPLRNELAELIAKEKNTSLLQVLRDILSGGSKNALLKAKLTARALKAEDDRLHGRVMTTEQLRERLTDRKKK
ncbi:MAG: hypothetical protein LKM36_12635 [Flavobacteriales bacterium]|jgi:hypothetical protein|nr:hypothetical protein [Flavobacteriales bacterium]